MGGWRLFWHHTVEKTLAFAPGLGAAATTCEGYVGCDLTVLTATVVVGGYFVFTQLSPVFRPPRSMKRTLARGLGEWPLHGGQC